ncbi:MAG TPA: PEP/pyruvate-binding domain-containing protein, partial [Gammaproteobacteria bacterium]
MSQSARYIRFFRETGLDDVPLVGGKNASLGEMYQTLSSQGVRVPNGFAITADAYRDMLTAADAWNSLHAVLDHIDPSNIDVLSKQAAQAREIVYRAGLSAELQQQILAAYRELQHEYGDTLTVAVRSSATAEDLPNASFAGQHDTYLNISGDDALLDACRRCFASLFTERAIHYRIDQGFDHFKVALSIGVMKMVRSDLAASGVIFSVDTETGFPDVVLITGSFGLGENVVQGMVNPDEFYVHKPTFQIGKRAVLSHMLGEKTLTMIYGDGGKNAVTTRNIDTPLAKRTQFCISDAEVLEL